MIGMTGGVPAPDDGAAAPDQSPDDVSVAAAVPAWLEQLRGALEGDLLEQQAGSQPAAVAQPAQDWCLQAQMDLIANMSSAVDGTEAKDNGDQQQEQRSRLRTVPSTDSLVNRFTWRFRFSYDNGYLDIVVCASRTVHGSADRVEGSR